MKATLICSLLLALPTVGASTLIHTYDLTSALTDLVGSTPLNSDGGSIGPAGYAFGANQGLNVSSALSNAGNYSILVDFSFQDLSGYRKILDFKDLASDNGVYNLNTDLNFYNFAFGPNGAFTVNTLARVIVTRDSGTGLEVGYVNGVQEFSFTDVSSDGVFTGTNGIIRFFEDDGATSQREASGGLATRISIYDSALSASEVADLGGPQTSSAVPEPASFLLLGTGLSLFVLARRR
uniref:Ice-binding protein C-terminal domain-containing protein n=1 Tax=Solibacter usitatus (strain Ellin6076) TaxID=234267 RepID=Q027E8_SOLUE